MNGVGRREKGQVPRCQPIRTLLWEMITMEILFGAWGSALIHLQPDSILCQTFVGLVEDFLRLPKLTLPSCRLQRKFVVCGRFTMHTSADAVLDHFHLRPGAVQLPLRFNIAPTQQVPVVRPSGAGRELAEMRWGLAPSWSNPKQGARMINARSETAAVKPSFRAAFKRRRCLVPSDGYFEWEKVGTKKLPQYIQMEDERLFAFAGLWERWGDREDPDSQLETFTVLTTSANELTAHVHERMPVILNPDDYDRWLDTEVQDAEQLQALFQPYPSGAMKMTRVSTRVNNVRHDDPSCLAVQQELF